MDSGTKKRIVASAAVLAVLCAYTWSLRLREVPAPPAPDLDSVPREIGERRAKNEYISPASLEVLGADLTLARSYESPRGDAIDLFIGYFAAQKEYSQIHSPKHCYPGAGWDIISESTVEVTIDGTASSAKSLSISDGVARQTVIYWFHMRDMTIPDEFALKWHQMTGALTARPRAASFIRFSAVVPPGRDEETEKRLLEFIEEISPHIIGALGPSGGGKEI